jgi:hypothetical protein
MRRQTSNGVAKKRHRLSDQKAALPIVKDDTSKLALSANFYVDFLWAEQSTYPNGKSNAWQQTIMAPHLMCFD